MDTTLKPIGPAYRRLLWRPIFIVFVSNACIMVLELVAERVIAPDVGVSLYTWTSIIGVVLAGMSLGYYVGGRMADRWASPRLLGLIFLLSGVLSFGILAVVQLGIVQAVRWPLIIEILVLMLATFFLPAAVLGTIPPIVAKLAMHDLASTGRTVGRIYAAGSVGSIVGTLLTGFVLSALFPTDRIIMGVGVLLVLLGLIHLIAFPPGTLTVVETPSPDAAPSAE
jgi:MFS family permease